MAPNCARARYYWCTSQAWPLGSLRSLFAPLIRPANAGMMFNGCAVGIVKASGVVECSRNREPRRGTSRPRVECLELRNNGKVTARF